MYASFAYFMSQLKDEAGRPLLVAEHHEEWCDLFQFEPLLCLLAPRDHGKSWTGAAYVLWRVWKHNRDPLTGELIAGLPQGRFEAVVFSATLDQARLLFEHVQSLLLANELFADLAPSRRRVVGRPGERWSSKRIRLRNLAEVGIRAYRTSSRGLHPDLIVLDDILNEENTLTDYQRGKVWRYFTSVLLPMNAKQYVVVGTALHQDDLLHRLQPSDPNHPERKPAVMRIGNRRVSFRWVKYRSVDWDTGQVLWPWKHDLEDLKGKRDLDPLGFAREYQNDPIDDASSMFPTTITGRALTRGASMTFVTSYRKDINEWVILGMDLAQSEKVGADYTVIWVGAFDRITGSRRILWGMREQGVGFDEMVNLLQSACRNFGVDLGIVEQNGFQSWLHARLMKLPETNSRIQGHTTGAEKTNLQTGVPSMKIALENDLWTFPSGDEQARALGHTWQAEMAAMGWKDGKLQGVGEHDDTVMAWWFLDRAIRLLEDWVWEEAQEGPDIVTAEDLGIEPAYVGEAF